MNCRKGSDHWFLPTSRQKDRRARFNRLHVSVVVCRDTNAQPKQGVDKSCTYVKKVNLVLKTYATSANITSATSEIGQSSTLTNKSAVHLENTDLTMWRVAILTSMNVSVRFSSMTWHAVFLAVLTFHLSANWKLTWQNSQHTSTRYWTSSMEGFRRYKSRQRESARKSARAVQYL